MSNVITFLTQSNYVEDEFSSVALEDSLTAWNKYENNSQKITINLVKDIHKIVMNRINPEIAGCLRDCNVTVGRRLCPAPQFVEGLLDEWVKKWGIVHKECYEQPLKTFCKHYNEDVQLIKQSHVEFEKIHPFKDGNGRVGRIIMNLQRVWARLPILVVYSEGAQTVSRDEIGQSSYYKWFND